jgi:hypothetical protein
MTTPPDVLHRLRNESRRPRVPRANLVMIAVSVLVAGVALVLVLGNVRSPVLERYARLFSLRTWRILEAVSLLFLFAMTAIGRAKRRDRT